MNKGLTLLISSLLASSLMANELELQVVGGKNFPDRKKISIYDDANTLGFRTNIFFSKNNALQLAYDNVDKVDGKDDADRYSINYMRTQRDNNSIVHPFMLIGGGYEDGLEEGQGYMNAGFGATIELTNSVNLVGEIKGIKKNKDNDFDINTNIGLGFMFGQEPKNETLKTNCDSDLEEIAPTLLESKALFEDDKVNCLR